LTVLLAVRPRFIGKTTWHTEPIGKLKTDRVAIIEGVEPTPT
jgi:hypothetical protein